MSTRITVGTDYLVVNQKEWHRLRDSEARLVSDLAAAEQRNADLIKELHSLVDDYPERQLTHALINKYGEQR